MTKRLLAALAALALALPVRAQDDNDYDARLTEVSGEVTVHFADGGAEGAPAGEDMPLEPGDKIVTGEDGTCEVALDADHAVYLKENTTFILSQPRKTNAVLELTLGSLIAKFTKLIAGQQLQIHTPTAIASVRGTEVAVEVEDATTHVGVFDEGKVEVQNDQGREILIAGQETKVLRGARPLAPYQLRRLVKHRRFMRSHLKRRPAALRRAWKRLPPQDRARLRREIIQKRLEWRRQRLEQMKQKMQERREPRQGPRKLRKDQERMERRKREIMERRRRER